MSPCPLESHWEEICDQSTPLRCAFQNSWKHITHPYSVPHALLLTGNTASCFDTGRLPLYLNCKVQNHTTCCRYNDVTPGPNVKVNGMLCLVGGGGERIVLSLHVVPPLISDMSWLHSVKTQSLFFHVQEALCCLVFYVHITIIALELWRIWLSELYKMAL